MNECGRCGLCDLERFRAWRARIEARLGESLEEGTPRMVLIHEIHKDVARRYPLGIAPRLASVIASLAYDCGENQDEDAIADLCDLEWDEQRGAEVNLDEVREVAKNCSTAAAWLAAHKAAST